MPLLSTDSSLADRVSALLARASDWVQGLSHHGGVQDVGGEYSATTVALIDERLRPKAPMPKDDVDMVTQMQLSHLGYRNARAVTAESHPELYSAWATMCQRAGYQKVPQLLITESKRPQASAMHSGEMMISTGLLQMLTLREVVGVLGHELGHGRREHAGPRIAATMAFGGLGALVGDYFGTRGGSLRLPWKFPAPLHSLQLPRWMTAPGRFFKQHFTDGHVRGTPASVLTTVGFIAAGAAVGQAFANQVSVKPTELQADLDGVAISGDPEALASALAKLGATDTRGPIKRWFGYMRTGYPTMQERVDNIRRAALDMPPNPVPSVLGPVPEPVVTQVAGASRVAGAPAGQAL